MLTRLHRSGKHLALSLIVGVTLVLVTSAALYASPARTQHTSTSSRGKTTILKSRRIDTPVRTGEVNLATLPVATAAEIAAASMKSAPINRSLKTPAQQAAYDQWARSHTSALPHVAGQPDPVGGPYSPNFVGGGTIPELVSKADKIDYSQSGGWNPPDQAIAAAPGYVFEGVNNVLEVFTPTYAQKYGPWTADTFFAPIKHAGATFGDPQITFDAERAVYLIAWLEITPNSCGTGCNNDYIDLAISKTSTPNPLGNFFEYSIPANVPINGYFCDYPTLGYDYWGTYVLCVDFNVSTGTFVDNSEFAFNTNGLLAGAIGPYFVWGTLTTDVNTCNGPCPAFRLSPAIEDGVPQAEWIIATDAGYGVASNYLLLCSITNTHGLTTATAPTFTCGANTLPLPYDDPVFADQPSGTATLYPGFGTKQIVYRDGQLYFALPAAYDCNGHTVDGILWAAVNPELTTFAAHNPQWVNGLVGAYTDSGIFCYINGQDAFMPTLEPGSEDDMALVFNYSSTSLHPSIIYTGRMADDQPGCMAQCLTPTSAYVIAGTSDNTTGRWGDYSACSLVTNLVTRGIAFCGGEYGGSDKWNTELYELRME
jgi:hypothetical protein